MAVYEGIGGVARQVANMYEGIGGVARQIVKGWEGIGGVAREFYNSSITIFENGAFQNGFSIFTGSLGVGKSTAYIGGTKLCIPYNSSADGICNLNVPSGFNASDYSYCCFDLYFSTVSYCGGVNGGPFEDNTDYAWYYMGVQLPGAGGGYEYDILDDNATNRLTIRVPLSAKTQTYAWFYPRSMRNKTYAATPTTYIYKIWME